MYLKEKYLDVMRSYLGATSEGHDPKHMHIVNTFNSSPLRNGKLYMNSAWCAATVSAAAIECGYAGSFMPVNYSCTKLIEELKKRGFWMESDDYVPKGGEWVFYSWNDDGTGDCTKQTNHVGVVEQGAVAGAFVVIEGNAGDDGTCKRITRRVNQKYLRGYGIFPWEESDPIEYVVKKGDTLSKIAKTYNTTWQKLAADNFIETPNLIYPGMKIIIRNLTDFYR